MNLCQPSHVIYLQQHPDPSFSRHLFEAEDRKVAAYAGEYNEFGRRSHRDMDKPPSFRISPVLSPLRLRWQGTMSERGDPLPMPAYPDVDV